MKKIAVLFALGIGILGATVLAQTTFLSGPKPEKKWLEYFYRANGAAPAPKPSTLLDGGTSVGFDFPTTPDVAGFQTKHPSFNEVLLGDLTGDTVTATFYITATGPFTYYGTCGTTPANVRLYFETLNNDLGESQYWWSNPVSSPLAGGPGALTATIDPDEWSDRDGHPGTFDAAHTAAFIAAAADVQQIGLSFGGGCFFANGVGVADGSGKFALTNFTVE